MAVASVKIGNSTVSALIDGEVRLPANLLFPSISAEEWEPFYPSLVDSDGTIGLSLGAFLVQNEEHRTLVDTGVGLAADAFQLPTGGIERGLSQLGLAEEDIDFVIFTHMHADHIGGACRILDGRSVPRYPRARYIIDRAEWSYWIDDAQAGRDPSLTPELVENCALPLRRERVLDLIDGACEPVGGLRIIPTPGHTPGHCAVLVSSAGEQLMIIGDAAHCPAQVIHPDWVIYAGTDKHLEARSRAALFEMIEEGGMLIAAGHYLGQNFGRFVRKNGQRVFEPIGENELCLR